MKKLLLSLFFVFAALTAYAQPRPTQDDFHACYEKNKGSIVSVNKHFGVAITKDLIAVPKNGDAPIVKYVKFDPFLQLYLVRSDAPLAAPVMADGADDEGTADSCGCDYSHPVAAGVPRRWQWAVVPWVTNAWL